ncbi:peptide/nickel transport system ATP-binding protein [Rathayibacter oskolensis]|uniref:Peptide/nickel transport system ATP-binding protein n=1 Tax=Rathayibacter oskolensis TaxID=1891671 RepID=A0A1X7PE69_9MICO|nr:ABC transporter ATP-binding protein [Rathayibacter oskolensis]SMH49506.1 peptide/nickel transport system ATP-binding protein [Rathayibacter oskolensis]
MSTDTLLTIQDAEVSYGSGPTRHVAVHDAAFSLERGEHVAIVGESGSGKTTLALAVAGLLTDPSVERRFGTFRFDGQDVVRGALRTVPHRTPGMSMVFQDAMTSLDPVATIGSQFTDVLRGVGSLGRRAAKQRATEWLQRVGLSDTERILKLRPYELSGGMRQRVMIALAICSEPKLLIADEPTSALDASVSRDVMDLLADMTQRTGASLLIVSHDIELCRMYVDRVIVMYHGRIVDICRADRIEEDATHPYTRALTACVPTLKTARMHRLPTLADQGRIDLDEAVSA